MNEGDTSLFRRALGHRLRLLSIASKVRKLGSSRSTGEHAPRPVWRKVDSLPHEVIKPPSAREEAQIPVTDVPDIPKPRSIPLLPGTEARNSFEIENHHEKQEVERHYPRSQHDSVLDQTSLNESRRKSTKTLGIVLSRGIPEEIVDACDTLCKQPQQSIQISHVELQSMAIEALILAAKYQEVEERTSTLIKRHEPGEETETRQWISRGYACLRLHGPLSAKAVMDFLRSSPVVPSEKSYKLNTLSACISLENNDFQTAFVQTMMAVEQLQVNSHLALREHDPKSIFPSGSTALEEHPLAELDLILGDLHLRNRDFQLASTSYEIAYQKMRNAWGFGNTKVLGAAARYLLSCVLLGQAETLIPFTEKVIGTQARLLGDHHPDVSFTHATLLVAYASVGHMENALSHLQQLETGCRERHVSALDCNMVSIIKKELDSRHKIKFDIYGHLAHTSLLKLVKISYPSETTTTTGQLCSSMRIAWDGGVPTKLSPVIQPLLEGIIDANATMVKRALQTLKEAHEALNAEHFDMWHHRVMQMALARAVRLSNSDVMHTLREHLEGFGGAPNERHRRSLLVQALCTAAEHESAQAIRALVEEKSPRASILSSSNIVSALEILLVNQSSNCLCSLLVDTDAAIGAFNTVMKDAIIDRRMDLLELLVTNMNENWLQRTQLGNMGRDELLQLQKKSNSWEEVVRVLHN